MKVIFRKNLSVRKFKELTKTKSLFMYSDNFAETKRSRFYLKRVGSVYIASCGEFGIIKESKDLKVLLKSLNSDVVHVV